MMADPLASVVINNFNYGRYLRDAVDSALRQTYSRLEVVVVDDGSTDSSRKIIAGYGDRIVLVLKDNGGQGSTFNAGLAASLGDVILFLDADDMLLSHAVANAVRCFDRPEVVKAHWPMWVVDRNGNRTGHVHPGAHLSEGDLREAVFRAGPTTQLAPPTSGNAWSRRFLEQGLPLNESLYRISADKYLQELAPFFGELRRIHAPQSLYRMHEHNSQRVTSVEDRLATELRLYDDYAGFLRQYCASQGVEVDLGTWKDNSWWHRQEKALRDIASLPRSDDPLLFVDEGAWGLGSVAGRQKIDFPSPADDQLAIRQLERMRAEGSSFLVFVWSTFWWLDHYAGLHSYLRSHFTCALDNERIVAFDLRSPTGNAA